MSHRQRKWKKLVCSWTWRELNEPANAAQTYILMASRILRYGNEPPGRMSDVFKFTRSAVVIWTAVGVYIKKLVMLQPKNKYKCSWNVMHHITSIAVKNDLVVFSSVYDSSNVVITESELEIKRRIMWSSQRCLFW